MRSSTTGITIKSFLMDRYHMFYVFSLRRTKPRPDAPASDSSATRNTQSRTIGAWVVLSDRKGKYTETHLPTTRRLPDADTLHGTWRSDFAIGCALARRSLLVRRRKNHSSTNHIIARANGTGVEDSTLTCMVHKYDRAVTETHWILCR